MTEDIHVISIQQTLQDLSDIRDVDRYYLLQEIAKETKIDMETLLAFDAMYYNYTPTPKIDSFKDILVSQILMDKRYIPTINLDITAKGNKFWEYYVPKNVPTNTFRVVLPYRKQVLYQSGDKKKNIIAPQGQIIDIMNINGLNLENNIKPLFITTEFVKVRELLKNNNFIDCNLIKLSQEKTMLTNIKLEAEYERFINNFKEFNIFLEKYYYGDSFIIDVTRHNLLDPLINYLENEEIDQSYYRVLLNKENNHNKEVKLTKIKNQLQIKLKIYTNLIYKNFGNKYNLTGKLTTILSELPKDVRKYIEDEYTKKTII